MCAQWSGGPHINHAGWLPPVKGGRGRGYGGGAGRMLTTETYAGGSRGNGGGGGRQAGAASEVLTAPTPVCTYTLPLPPTNAPTSLLALYPSPLSDSPTPPTSPHQPPPTRRANQAATAAVRATEMGHFLIKYNINYCEHHYRYVRFD